MNQKIDYNEDLVIENFYKIVAPNPTNDKMIACFTEIFKNYYIKGYQLAITHIEQNLIKKTI